MQTHEIKPVHRRKSSKRVGRGGKRGTFSGRGVKGQKSRSGRRMMPAVRSMLKRYHKLKGYNFKGRKGDYLPLNLEKISKAFKDGEKVSFRELIKRGLADKMKTRTKVLGKGSLKKALHFKGLSVSKKAREAIEKAGGSVS